MCAQLSFLQVGGALQGPRSAQGHFSCHSTLVTTPLPTRASWAWSPPEALIPPNQLLQLEVRRGLEEGGKEAAFHWPSALGPELPAMLRGYSQIPTGLPSPPHGGTIPVPLPRWVLAGVLGASSQLGVTGGCSRSPGRSEGPHSGDFIVCWPLPPSVP